MESLEDFQARQLSGVSIPLDSRMQRGYKFVIDHRIRCIAVHDEKTDKEIQRFNEPIDIDPGWFRYWDHRLIRLSDS